MTINIGDVVLYTEQMTGNVRVGRAFRLFNDGDIGIDIDEPRLVVRNHLDVIPLTHEQALNLVIAMKKAQRMTYTDDE